MDLYFPDIDKSLYIFKDSLKLMIDQILKNLGELYSKCKYSDRFCFLEKDTFKSIRDEINEFNNYSNVEMNVIKHNDWLVEITLEGNLIDIFGIIEVLRFYQRFHTLRHCITTDMNMVDNMINGGTPHNAFEMDSSIMLKYIGEKNLSNNSNNVFSHLRNIKEDKVLLLIHRVCKEVYGIALLEMPKLLKTNDNGNKLSTSNISDKVIKDLEKYVMKNV